MEEKIFKNSDAVIDLAALSNDPAGEINHQLIKDINFYGRLRITKLAKKYILGSTCSVYGKTKNFPEDEILKIYSVLKTGKIKFSEKNITVKWCKYLIEAEKILREVKVKEKLFY